DQDNLGKGLSEYCPTDSRPGYELKVSKLFPARLARLLKAYESLLPTSRLPVPMLLGYSGDRSPKSEAPHVSRGSPAGLQTKGRTLDSGSDFPQLPAVESKTRTPGKSSGHLPPREPTPSHVLWWRFHPS